MGVACFESHFLTDLPGYVWINFHKQSGYVCTKPWELLPCCWAFVCFVDFFLLFVSVKFFVLELNSIFFFIILCLFSHLVLYWWDQSPTELFHIIRVILKRQWHNKIFPPVEWLIVDFTLNNSNKSLKNLRFHCALRRIKINRAFRGSWSFGTFSH